MSRKDLPLPWKQSPLIFSDILSAKLNANVYLKLEHLHPSYSFKQRTLGLLAREEVQKHGPTVTLVIASGGNAGLSAAHAARQLGVKCIVFIPFPSYKQSMIDALERFGAIAHGAGENYAEALVKAQEYVAEAPNAVLMPPYDHPTLWQGSSSLVDEIAEQLPSSVGAPDAIICSVGGGSVLGGLLIGTERQKWNETRLIAIEPTGSDSMYFSVLASTDPSFTPPSRVALVPTATPGVTQACITPTSRATSLGASSNAPGVIRLAAERRTRDLTKMTMVNIPDELAMLACLGFADDHKTLAEISAGIAIAPLYTPALFEQLFPPTPDAAKRNIVFIMCGGQKISLRDMVEYQAHLDAVSKENGTKSFTIGIDGREMKVDFPSSSG